MNPFEPFHAKVNTPHAPIITVTEECFVTKEMAEDLPGDVLHALMVKSLRGKIFVRDLVLVGVGDVVLSERSIPDRDDPLRPEEPGVLRAVLQGWAIKGELLS